MIISLLSFLFSAGPAGYSAGLYAARANLKPILFQGTDAPGGQLLTTDIIENYLGCDETNGFELTERFRVHAEKYGVQSLQRQVVSVDTTHTPFVVTDDEKTQYQTKSIIIGTGAKAKRLNLPSEERFWNNGISACAVCDGALPMFRGKPVAVVGGGDTSMEEAIFLTKFASKVYLIHRNDAFRASRILVDRALNNPKIEMVKNATILDVFGDESVRKIRIKRKCGTEIELEASGLFYAIGHTPNTEFLLGSGLDCDLDGYLVTKPGSTETNIPGVFACGDVQDKKYRQAITSAGSGCMAALDANAWLSENE